MPDAPRTGALDGHVLFVVATAAQAGKSTATRLISRLTGADVAVTSAVVAAETEALLGLPAGSIAAARAADPERYRAELIAAGDAMRAAGRHPGAICIEAGFRLIDGIRTAAELSAAMGAAERAGLRCSVLCIERSGEGTVADNSEPAALRAAASVVVVNDAGIERFRRRVRRAVQELLEG
jgi:hypothetical protein